MERTAEDIEIARRETAFFDSLVTETGDFNSFTARGWNSLKRRFEKMLEPQRLERKLNLLDVGCGTARSYQIYADHVGTYTGLDLSGRELLVAQKRFPDAQLVRGDACAMPFAEASFDVVCFSAVLHHIPHFPNALSQGLRVLRPGGWAFAFDPNLLHPAFALLRHPKSPLYTSNGVSPNERPLFPSELRAAFASTGFAEIRQRCQSDIPYRSVAPKLIRACLSLYNAADRLWEYSGLARWFGTLVVTAGRKPA
jgi:ubiquinone/menaquinone biosynthesis C-methylase UbiE